MAERLIDKINVKNIIFDFDGTLVDSSIDIIQCLVQAYSNLSISMKITPTKSIIGPPLEKIIRQVSPDISDETTNLIIKEFRLLYEKSGFPNTITYCGVPELLENLKSEDIRLFIATNKPIRFVTHIINKLNINYFVDVASLDLIFGKTMDKSDMLKFLVKKWNLNVSESMMVGDSELDILAALENGMIPVAFTGGYGNLVNIYNKNHDIYFISNLHKLQSLLLTKFVVDK